MASFAQRAAERRQLGDQLLYQMDGQAACKGHSSLWKLVEQAYQLAVTREGVEEAIAPALAMCARCPVLQLCERWAEAELYSGVAAGTVWVAGRRRRVDLLPGRESVEGSAQ